MNTLTSVANNLLDSAWYDELSLLSEMAWATRQYLISEVNQAGRMLVNPLATPAELDHALTVINNWRSCHSYPLNILQNGLRQRAKQADPNRLIAQRIKRIASIKLKLSQQKTMRLTQMQDIGGCRAIVGSVAQVEKLVDLYKRSDLKHERGPEDNYISNPRASGYRGIHLIYRYFSDRIETWNELQIEVQLRTKLQHAWATTVETIGMLREEALKSSLGNPEWMRFFALMGSVHAIRERRPIVRGTPGSEKDLLRELRDLTKRLNVMDTLNTYATVLGVPQHPTLREASYFLMKLQPTQNRVQVTGFRSNQLQEATQQYLATERTIVGNTGEQAVLVSVDSLKNLRRAYPNYFLDARVFTDSLHQVLAKK